MKKDQIVKIILGALAAMLVIYYYLNTERYNHYNWSETYDKDSKIPYGNFMLYDLLKNYSGPDNFEIIDQPLALVLSDTTLVNTNYVFKGLNSYHSYNDILVLKDYIARGNNVFMLSNDDSFDLVYEMTESLDGIIYSQEAQVARMGMVDEEDELYDITEFKFIVNWEPKDYFWNYIEYWTEAEDDPALELTVLGRYDDGLINFIEVEHGLGQLYYHTSPIVFTNFYLKDEKGLAYAQHVFQHLNGNKIYWDDFNHRPNLADNQSQSNPLQYIMSQPPLRWAWYLILIIGLIYLIFYTRRRERIIPVLPKNLNTSIEFIETIASLYMQPNGNFKIVRHKKKLFLDYIRDHYFIPTNVIDNEFVNTVSLKSGIEKDKIAQILNEGERLENVPSVTDELLIAYHKQTEYFYKNCK